MNKRQNKNIISIESWENLYLEPRAGMKSLLDFITSIQGTRYSYNFCHTPTELEYLLKNIPTKNFALLYFAVHGQPEKIQTGMFSEFEIPLHKLAKMMGTKFSGMAVHFASCAVMSSSSETIQEFMWNTGVAFVSGYTKYVDFEESSLADLAFINRWMYAKNYKRMFENMKKSYKTILSENGFKYYV